MIRPWNIHELTKPYTKLERLKLLMATTLLLSTVLGCRDKYNNDNQDTVDISVECAQIKQGHLLKYPVFQVFVRNNSDSEARVHNVLTCETGTSIWSECGIWSLSSNPILPGNTAMLQFCGRQGDAEIASVRLLLTNNKQVDLTINPTQQKICIDSITFNTALNKIFIYLRNTTTQSIVLKNITVESEYTKQKKITDTLREVLLPNDITCIEIKLEESLESYESVYVYAESENGMITNALIKAHSQFIIGDSENLAPLRITQYQWNHYPEGDEVEVFIYNETKRPIQITKVFVAGIDITHKVTVPLTPLPPDAHNYDSDRATIVVPIPKLSKLPSLVSIRVEGKYADGQQNSQACVTEALLCPDHYLPIGTNLTYPSGLMPLFLCDLRPQQASIALTHIRKAADLLSSQKRPALGYISLCPGQREDEYRIFPLFCDLLVLYPNEVTLADILNDNKVLKGKRINTIANPYTKMTEAIEYAREAMAPKGIIARVGPGLNKLTTKFASEELRMLIYTCIAKGCHGILFDVPKFKLDYSPDLIKSKMTITKELETLQSYLEISYPAPIESVAEKGISVDTLMCGRKNILLILRNMNNSASVSDLPYDYTPAEMVKVIINIPEQYDIKHISQLVPLSNTRNKSAWKKSKHQFEISISEIDTVKVLLLSANELEKNNFKKLQYTEDKFSINKAGVKYGIKCSTNNYQFLGVIPSETEHSISFELYNVSDEIYTFGQIELEGDNISATLDSPIIKPGETTNLMINIPASQQEGFFASRLKVSANSSNSEILTFQVSGIRQQAVSILPSYIDFGTFYKNTSPLKHITIKGIIEPNFAVLRGQSKYGFVSINIEGESTVVTPCIAVPGKFTDEILLETNSIYCPNIVLSVYGCVDRLISVTPMEINIVAPKEGSTYFRKLRLKSAPDVRYKIEEIHAEVPGSNCKVGWHDDLTSNSSVINCKVTAETLPPNAPKGQVIILLKTDQEETMSIKVPITFILPKKGNI